MQNRSDLITSGVVKLSDKCKSGINFQSEIGNTGKRDSLQLRGRKLI